MAKQTVDLGSVIANGADGDTAREAFTKVNSNFTEVYDNLQNQSGNLDTKVDKVVGKSLVDDTEIGKLLTVQANATQNSEDSFLLDRSNHTGIQAIDSISGLQSELDNKEEKLVQGAGITIDRTNPNAPVISAAGSGLGDVVGPASSISGEVVLFNSNTGKTIAGGGVLGSAAFTNSDAYVSPQQLTALEGLLVADDATKGAALIPYNESLDYADGSVGAALRNVKAYQSRASVETLSVPETVASIQLADTGAVYNRFVVEPEAQAIIDKTNSLSATPLTKRKEWAVNHAVRQLKSAGLLSEGKIGSMLELGGIGQVEQSCALVDWIRPAIVNPVITGTGAVVYTPGKGLQLSGANYLNLGVGFDTIPGVSLNSAHAGIFIDGTGDFDYTQFNDNAVIGGGSRLGIRPSNAVGGVAALLNTNTAANIGSQVAGRAGHTVACRTSSSVVSAYRDADLVGEAASASQSVSSSLVTVGWWSTPNQFSTDTFGFVHFGGALNDTEVSVLYDTMTEYRYVIQSNANPGYLLQSADGAWWELGEGFERTPYHYGADEVDDTEAFKNLCAIKQDAYIPRPRSFFRVQNGFKVFAAVRGNGARIRMEINVQNSRSWDMQDKSALTGVVLDHYIDPALAAPSEGGQHCGVLLGRFHGTQTPVRDVEIDVKVNLLTPTPAAVYVIGNVKSPTISYNVSGRIVNGAAFLAHWGTQQSDANTEHVIQRPRKGRIVRGVAHSKILPGHRGFYYSGVSDWHVDYLECRNFTACMAVAPGDKPNSLDAACFNETAGLLLADLTFGKVNLIDPAGTACRMWGRTAFINGLRWYSTDNDSNASTHIEELNILRSDATSQIGNEAVMLDIDIGANITIPKLNINHRPGTSAAVLEVTEPLVRINGARNVQIAGKVIGRVGTHIYSGVNIDLAIAAQNPISGEPSSTSAGVWLRGETVTGQLTSAVSVGDTTISLLRSPATHIVPGMQFDYNGVRYVFDSSQAGDNLLDDNITMKILPAPAAIASGQLIVVLGGAMNSKLHGSETRYYRGIVISGSDPRIPNQINIVPTITWSMDDNMELDCGSGIYITGGVMDYGNRRNDAAGRDIRINANARDIYITGVRFSPSPGSRQTVNHILANAGCSGIIARDNYGFGTTSVKFSIPVTGADGKPNVNSNYEAP